MLVIGTWILSQISVDNQIMYCTIGCDVLVEFSVLGSGYVQELIYHILNWSLAKKFFKPNELTWFVHGICDFTIGLNHSTCIGRFLIIQSSIGQVTLQWSDTNCFKNRILNNTRLHLKYAYFPLRYKREILYNTSEQLDSGSIKCWLKFFDRGLREASVFIYTCEGAL